VLEVVPGMPVTNTEIHFIAHTTQGQTSSKLTGTQSRPYHQTSGTTMPTMPSFGLDKKQNIIKTRNLIYIIFLICLTNTY
jgi:hypothetical protein